MGSGTPRPELQATPGLAMMNNPLGGVRDLAPASGRSPRPGAWGHCSQSQRVCRHWRTFSSAQRSDQYTASQSSKIRCLSNGQEGLGSVAGCQKAKSSGAVYHQLRVHGEGCWFTAALGRTAGYSV